MAHNVIITMGINKDTKVFNMSKFDRLLGLKHIYLDFLLLKTIVLSFAKSIQILSNLHKADGDDAIVHVSPACIK